jgi:hypothetical protein
LKEQVLAIFGKAQDEAMKLVDAEPDKKDGDKEAKKEEAKDAPAFDAAAVMKAIDELKGMLGEKKDGDKEVKKDEPAKDEGSEVAPSLEDRLTKLEAAVAKLLEGRADADSEIGDEDDSEEFEDEDGDDEVVDEKADKKSLIGDEASKIEVLAPGLKVQKNGKVEALKVAYATRDGKKAIETLIGKRAPAFDSAPEIDMLFNGASEILKLSRSDEFSRTKQVRDSAADNASSEMTAEKMNEFNQQYYKRN